MHGGLIREWHLPKWEEGQGQGSFCTWSNAMVTHSHLLATVPAKAASGRDPVAKEVDLMEAFPFFYPSISSSVEFAW